MKDERWVEERMKAIDPAADWHPDPGAALTRFRSRDRQYEGRRQNWRRGLVWSLATASVAVLALTALPAPAKCALVGVGCPRPAHMPVAFAPAAKLGPEAVSAAVYKSSGAAAAPVVCEIYTDYECPSCAAFYTTVFPQFVAEFVKTGQVRVVHRDFPLPQHPFARLAARYANAAGETGYYEEVVSHLFASQPQWSATGNVDAAVMQVLAPETMQKVRALVNGDPRLDATLMADLSMVARDQVNQTPTIVFVYRGTRRKVAGAPSLELLRMYLRQMLAR